MVVLKLTSAFVDGHQCSEVFFASSTTFVVVVFAELHFLDGDCHAALNSSSASVPRPRKRAANPIVGGMMKMVMTSPLSRGSFTRSHAFGQHLHIYVE